MFRVLSISAFVLWAAAPVCSQDTKRDIEFRENVEYGTGGGQKLLLNLALPKGEDSPRPVVLVIHGGGWAGGNRNGHNPQVKELAALGYVAATVGYRLADKNKPDDATLRFPAQIEDVKCAVRWVRAHAGELNADPNRIGAIGFSAGAHLSMMLGAMDKDDGLEGEGGWPDQSSKVQAVVAYFGPTDLLLEYPETSQKIVANFIGGDKESKKDEYRQASPIAYVNVGDAPMLIYQGTEDVLVPYEQAWVMAQAMTKAKIPGRVEFLIGANHGWGGPELERTKRDSWAFFDQWLRKKQQGRD